MTFSRVKPSGWTINEKLSSAQMTQIDIDHAKAVDKTGDTTTGTIHIGTGSSLVLDSGSTGTVNTTVTLGAGGKISTSGTGTIELANNDYTKLAVGHSGRSRTITVPFSTVPYSGTTFNLASYSTYGVGGIGAIEYMIVPKEALHIGATLSSIDILFVVPSSKTTIPVTLPNVQVFYLPLSVGSAVAAPAFLHSVNTTQYYSPNPANIAAWIDSQKLKALTFTTNQNNVIASNNTYFVNLYDESGSGAQAGNQYYAVNFNYTLITDMRFA